MLGFVKKDRGHREALGRVREWTRVRFRLAADATIMVSEVACKLPGCPPLETVIVFWAGEQRHHLNVFKPAAAVTDDDLPPGWLRSAYAVDDSFICECC